MWRVERLSVLALKEEEGPGRADAQGERGDRGESPDAPPGVSVVQMDALVGEVRSLREENAQYRLVIEMQAGAVDRLTQGMAELRELIERALPPPREEEPGETDTPEDSTERVPWWRWLWPW